MSSSPIKPDAVRSLDPKNFNGHPNPGASRPVETVLATLKALETVYETNERTEDIRLGQFISNLLHRNGLTDENLFGLEDHVLLAMVEAYPFPAIAD